MRGFIGQEATHRRIHALFNAQIEKHGLVNEWEPRARKRLQLLEGTDPRHSLAITAANEHFTALFAEWLLSHPTLLDGCEPRLKALWQWHSAEEAEHKCTAFDLYQRLGGSLAFALKGGHEGLRRGARGHRRPHRAQLLDRRHLDDALRGAGGTVLRVGGGGGVPAGLRARRGEPPRPVPEPVAAVAVPDDQACPRDEESRGVDNLRKRRFT